MKIKINVTKEVIKKAMMCGTDDSIVSENCAIALAVRDLFPRASVTLDEILFDETQRARLPSIARCFILLFDGLRETPEERLTIDPISFEINVPYEVIQQIGIGQVYKVLSESRTLSHVN